MKTDYEQNIGVTAEWSSRLTNPKFLVKAGYEFLEKYSEDLRKTADFYARPDRQKDENTPLPVEDMAKKYNAFNFLTDRLSFVFPEFGDELDDPDKPYRSQSTDLYFRLAKTLNFLDRAKAFIDLTEE